MTICVKNHFETTYFDEKLKTVYCENREILELVCLSFSFPVLKCTKACNDATKLTLLSEGI